MKPITKRLCALAALGTAFIAAWVSVVDAGGALQMLQRDLVCWGVYP